LGSHLGERLRAAGATVVGVDNLAFARPDRGPETFELRHGDLRDAAALKSAVDAVAPDVVFHLAAVANPRTCKQNFPLAFDVNVTGTRNLFEAVGPSARVVLMSSAAVYGNPIKVPIDESHPRNGADPYSVTKILGEVLASLYNDHYGRNIVTIRNFNTFGVGQTGDYIVPQLIRQALTERKMEVWDPSTVRDLTYIDNTVDALLTVAAGTDKGPINLGAGRATSVGDIAAIVARLVGGDVPVVDLKKKVLGSTALVSDNHRLRALGWSERVSFEEGLRRTIDWTRGQIAAPAA
jgi:UDP-glucose 4-epimerase